ncbi:MAG: NADH-quinone oxidoreductase subunit M [Acidimicrobiaceae bacterium]|nr:NADH-quinone oxidoreductase subunit M [Acidimicrobiaceae bacterium]|tara:strand:- start:4192 stop:5868 length:1677 start_codon:yes stop_codon:yes gene_type:complete
MSSSFLVAALSSAGPSFPTIPALVLLPIIGAIAVAVTPSARIGLHKLVATIFSGTVGAISVWALAAFETNSDFQFISQTTWIESLGIQWFAGIDGISLFLVVLTGLLFPLAIVAINPSHDHKAYYVWILLLQSGCMGVFVALDLFMFFVFFEIVLIPMYFLIGKWGHGNAKYAATKFFLFTMLGSALMLVSIIALASLHSRDSGNDITFNLLEIAQNPAISTNTGRLLFLGFAIAFAVKVPLFPVHTWLPDAHTEAPTAGSVILAGVMLKLGTYGFIRFGLFLFPEASHYFAPIFLTLGVIGILYGAVVATMQSDLKRLVAYSSIAHLGFIILGTFALNTQGIQGATVQMVNHGISTGALFLLVGIIYERKHTREIAELGGIQKSAPILAGVFTLVMLSSIGLPGLNGFVGEFLILLGVFTAHRWWALLAAVGVILAALYLLWAYQRVFHGPEEQAENKTKDLTPWERLFLLPLIVAIVFLGIYPKPMLKKIEPAADKLVAHIEQHVDNGTFQEPTPTVGLRTSFADLVEDSHKHGGHHGSDEHHDSDDHHEEKGGHN